MCIYSIVCHADSCVYTGTYRYIQAKGTYKPFAVSAPKIELWEPGINGIIKCIVNDKTKMLKWQ